LHDADALGLTKLLTDVAQFADDLEPKLLMEFNARGVR
jgi:hypothetical protein